MNRLTSSVIHIVLRIPQSIGSAQCPRMVDIINLGLEHYIPRLSIQIIMHHLMEKDPHLVLPHARSRRRRVLRILPNKAVRTTADDGTAVVWREWRNLVEKEGTENYPRTRVYVRCCEWRIGFDTLGVSIGDAPVLSV